MLNLEIKEQVEAYFAAHLSAEIVLYQDALHVYLVNGVEIEIRILDDSQYSFVWHWGDAKLRIDTAPIHQLLSTFPNHLHDNDDRLLPDPITIVGDTPWHNVQKLLARLIVDPLLQAA